MIWSKKRKALKTKPIVGIVLSAFLVSFIYHSLFATFNNVILLNYNVTRHGRRCEFEIIEVLKAKYPIVFLCQLTGVSKSGYYKWKKRQGTLNQHEKTGRCLRSSLFEQHEKHPSHGYHMLAEDVFQETGWVFSHNLAHKCCKIAGIQSKARKYRYKKKDGEDHVKFANEVQGNWNASRPIQIVVSDMTVFKNNGMNWEWTLLVDTFNNEILAHQATPITGSNKPYYHCLEVLKKLAGKKNEEQTPQVVLHTDLGTAENVPKLLDEYVDYFNHRRPAATLGYKSPVQYKTELGF